MASNRVRGITLEINGDTTGLTKALQGVNGKIRDTQTTLKDVDKLLKLDPTNTELLSQKQKLLAQAVESTQDKLKTLKTASEEAAKSAGNYEAWKEKYEPLQKEIDETSDKLRELRQKAADAKEQFEGGKISEDQYKAIQGELAETSAKLKELKEQKKDLDDEFGHPISPEQYDALQREIIETEQDLQKLESAADDTGQELDELDDAADDVNVSFGSMVKNKVVDMLGDALLDIGRKAVDAAKYCVEVGSSFGSAMSKVKATSGASSQSMTRLADKAKEMGAKTKFSATEAGEAMNYMAMAGWKTEDMLSGIDGVMNLAAASGEDLATTSDIVTDALTAFGKSSEESGRLADIMAAASANANTNVGMMGETFKYAAPVAGALGYSMEDTALAIGLMANSGIKASQAGTSIRSGLTRLAAPTKQVREAMDKYGISLTDASGNMLSFRELMLQMREKLGGLSEAEQTAAVSALAGKNAMSGWLAIINGSDSDFDKLSGAIDNSNGAAERMAETMQDNLSGKVTILQSALEGLGIAVYEYVSGPLQSVVEFVTGIISGITDAITPQRTELEVFIDDIDKANDQVERSLEHARQTIAEKDAKIAEIEAYQGMLDGILSSCEEFNLVTLDDGTQAIVNSSGEVVKSFETIDTSAKTTEEILDQWEAGGFNTDGIRSSSEEAQELIGFVSESADTVETRLDNFVASGFNTEGIKEGKAAFIQVFDDIGKKIQGYTTQIDEAGDIELDTAGIETGTTLAVTYFNEASGKVETFKGDLESLSGSNINLSQISSQFDQVEDSVKRTYVITDEFTKQKINNMIEKLGDSVQGLAKAWNAQTGELTATNEELATWFDTAKDIAEYKALQKAMDELYDAWGEASINVLMADSAFKKAQAELDAFTQQYGRNSEYALMNAEDWAAEQVELEAAVKQATKEQERANAALNEAQEQLNTTGASLKDMKENMDAQAQAAVESTEATEGSIEAVGELGDESEEAADQVEKLTEKQQEAITSLGELYNASAEDLAAIREELGKSEADFADWAQGIVDANEETIENYKNLRSKLVEEMEAMVFDLSGEGSPLDNLENNLRARNEALRSWITNMQELMAQVEAGNLEQRVYDSLIEMGPEKGAEAAATFANGFREGNYEQIDRIQAEYATQLDLSQNADLLLSGHSTGEAFAYATADHTVEELRELAGTTIKGAAVEAGKTASDSIADGVSEDSPLIEEALSNSVTDATDSATTEAEKAKDTGETMGDSTKEGIESTKAEVKKATEGMISDARDAADVIVSEFHRTGQLIPQKVKQGIEEANNMGVGPVSAVEGMMDDAVEAVRAAVPDMESAAQELMNALTTATSNFVWFLPRPRIPHINWSWNRITYGDGGWFDIPEFSVDWFTKAMKDGMILNDPTIFGAMNGKLLGAGEAGSEVVVGTHSLMDMIQQAVSQQQAANVNNFGGVTVNVYGHEGQDIRQLADEIEYRIALNVKRKEAGFA